MNNKKPRKKILIALPLLVLISLLIIYTIFANEDDQTTVRISGNIEATDAAVSARIAGRIEQRLVSEGETIRQGQLVARLENSELLQEVALQEAEVRAAKAVLAELEAGSRPEEIAQAEASLQKAQANLDALRAGSRQQEIAAAKAVVERNRAEAAKQKSELDRQQYLRDQGIASEREFDAAKTAYATSEAMVQESLEQLKLVQEGPRKEEIDAGRAAVQEAKEKYALVKKGPRAETIEQARARLEQAEEALQLSKTKLGYTELYSPLSGVILSEHVESGEYVNAGTPIVTIGDLENVWLRGYVSETDLGRVKAGQPVRVRTDTFTDKVYEGRISFIASQAEFTPKNVQTEEQRVKLVYRVKVDIANENFELKPGMPADAEILVQRDE